MRFGIDTLSGRSLEAAAAQYEHDGFIVIEGLGDRIAELYRPIMAERMRLSPTELDGVLDPDSPPLILPVEIRERLSRIASSPGLQAALLQRLGPVFRRLLGPVVHVSSTFHGQIKGGDVKPVDHGGYDPNAQFLEVQGQYLIHQDFTGANLPTSPSAVTLWTPLNSSPDWNLRLYPGSHRLGLLTHQWISLDDEWLDQFGTPIDIPAEAGTAVVFNSLLLHASSRPGPHRRVSCDIRFFPLCPFLPSPVHILGETPLEDLRAGLARSDGPTLRAPFLEDAAFLGLRSGPEPCPPGSILNWANFVWAQTSGHPDEARAHLARFVNPERGRDEPDIYLDKFAGKPIHREPLEGLLERLRREAPDAPEVRALAARLEGQLTVA